MFKKRRTARIDNLILSQEGAVLLNIYEKVLFDCEIMREPLL